MINKNILIVGAGFAGAVHARELAEAGCDVHVIDRRPHIAGNAFDYVHETGVRIHLYGPHLFHTSNERVVEWLSRFTRWIPYEHRVVARLGDGRLVPMPVNLDTINAFFDTDLQSAEDVQRFLETKAVKRDPVETAADYLYSVIGPELTDAFFRPYTKKMWAHDLEDLDADIVKRLQIRTDREDRYFPNDTFQALPADGYERIFENIFDHSRIDVRLSTEFERSMIDDFDFCFTSMPIDEFFDFDLGELPYRSIRFHLTAQDRAGAPPHATINYTDTGPFTRETWWHNLAGHSIVDGPQVARTIEEPCDYRDNDYERYYPVKTHDGRYEQLYRQYRDRAGQLDKIEFIGRCGTYQYLDMHQVINQSLANCHKWIAANGAGSTN